MKLITRLPLFLLLWLGLVPFAAAQAAPFPHLLLALLPDDFAVCVVMHDLRGNASRWEQSAWLKKFRASPLGKTVLDSPEYHQLEKMQNELKKTLDLDWPTLRDDILGDTLILSYTPGPKTKPDEERGLFLLQVRNPDRLKQAIKKLNEVQIKAGKLKLTALEHNGATYYRREEGTKSQYYIVKDSLAAVASNEATMKSFLERQAKPRESPWKKRFEQARADAAFVTLCVNPRMLDAEILQGRKKDDPLPGYWKALDAIFVTGSIGDDAEVRVVIQAQVDKLPEWARGAFSHTAPASSLWQRFPEQSILTIATKTDFTGLADALKMLMPAEERQKLDALKDLLPVIGPDWGVCVLPSKNAEQLPHVLFAIAFKSGPKDRPGESAVLGGLELLLDVALKAHNQNNPKAQIVVKTLKQGKIEVKYLDGPLPGGLQPAWALKDGFLLIATSPEAIASFRTLDKQAVPPKDAPILRISAPELAKLLEHRRKHILDSLTEKDAEKNLNNVIALLGLFDRLTVSHHGDAGQATWTIRLTPAK